MTGNWGNAFQPSLRGDLKEVGVMRKLRWVPVFMLLVLSLALLGGCGGGGGGNDGGKPAPAPSPQPSPTPTPQPGDEIDIKALAGSWEAVAGSGSGTATGPDGKYDLKMVSVSSTFANVTGSGSTATALVASASARWESYQNGVYQRTIPLAYQNERVQLQRISKNTWQYVFPSNESKLTFTFESATRAKVIEEGNFGLGTYNYQYRGTYTMTKR